MIHVIETETQYFTLKKLAEGVFAAIVKDGTGAWGNAGIIDLGGETLIFDTFSTPKAALELRKIAEQVTPSKIKYVINSHCHFDHVIGNQVFSDATIISTDETYNLMKAMYDFSDIEKDKKEFIDHIDDLKQQMEDATDPAVIHSLKTIEIEEKTRFLEALDSITLQLPDVTFKDSLIIHGEKRTVELHSFGGGHSQNDTFLVLPEEKIMFTGDLVFEGTHPSIHVQSPKEWISILEKMKTIDVDTLVPGHGDITHKNQFDVMLVYLTAIIEKVKDVYLTGKTIEEIADIPSAYKHWKLAHVYKWNLNSIFNQLSQQAEQ